MFPTNFKDAVDSGFFMYMAEAEGMTNLVSTRTAKINAIIKDFKYIKGRVENMNEYIPDILEKYGLTEDDLTTREKERIQREVNGY